MNRIYWKLFVGLIMVLVGGVLLLNRAESAPLPARAPSAHPQPNHCTTRTKDVQTKLASYGYSIVIDGDYGQQTTKMVKLWQKANGLFEDGCAGPITLRSLGLDRPPTASGGTTAQAPAAGSGDPPPPVPAADPGDVESIIREVWPDDLEDEAVRIAKRESSLVPTAKNSCCSGLLQIHKIHLAWLCPELGICSRDQLLDARTNAIAGYALYQRDGWGPWQ